MQTLNTPNGLVEILRQVNKTQVHARFVETGGELITTEAKLMKGTASDPLAPTVRKARWTAVLTDGRTIQTYDLFEIAEAASVHSATVRKIAQGERRHPAIKSISKI